MRLHQGHSGAAVSVPAWQERALESPAGTRGQMKRSLPSQLTQMWARGTLKAVSEQTPRDGVPSLAHLDSSRARATDQAADISGQQGRVARTACAWGPGCGGVSHSHHLPVLPRPPPRPKESCPFLQIMLRFQLLSRSSALLSTWPWGGHGDGPTWRAGEGMGHGRG